MKKLLFIILILTISQTAYSQMDSNTIKRGFYFDWFPSNEFISPSFGFEWLLDNHFFFKIATQIPLNYLQRTEKYSKNILLSSNYLLKINKIKFLGFGIGVAYQENKDFWPDIIQMIDDNVHSINSNVLIIISINYRILYKDGLFDFGNVGVSQGFYYDKGLKTMITLTFGLGIKLF